MATALHAEPPAGALAPLPFRVTDRVQDTADTWTLTLERVSGAQPVVAPGQFVMVYAFGVGEIPISVSGPPNRAGPLVLTVRAVGAVSRAVTAAAPGAVLGIRGPFGTSWPIDAAAGTDIVVVAGGIGLAPLRPVVLRALERRASYETVTVLYGARTPQDLLYPDQLAEWASHISVDVTVDAADATWHGKVGVVPKLLGGALFRPEATTAFVCGPEVMMHFTIESLLRRGVAPDRIMISMERDMRCGVGLCGHCQLGPTLICRDGPVYSYPELCAWLAVREL
jgi:NAD(P)H-flavin reductase